MSLSAFLHFTAASGGGRGRRIPPEAIVRTAPALVAWSRVPNGTVVLDRGLSEWVVTPGRTLVEFLAGLPAEPPQFGLRQVTVQPRRLRLAAFTFDARAALQVMDETSDDVTVLRDVIDGMKICAPWLDYAYVRRAENVIPRESTPFPADRPRTTVERRVANGRASHLLATHVPDVHVAQVLTDFHVAHASWDLFDLSPLEGGRHLAVAKDPVPWLGPEGAAPGLLQEARERIRDILLTDEVLAANPPPGREGHDRYQLRDSPANPSVGA